MRSKGVWEGGQLYYTRHDLQQITGWGESWTYRQLQHGFLPPPDRISGYHNCQRLWRPAVVLAAVRRMRRAQNVPPPPPPSRPMKATELAAMLGVSRARVGQLASRGKIPGMTVRPGHHPQFDREVATAWAQQRIASRSPSG